MVCPMFGATPIDGICCTTTARPSTGPNSRSVRGQRLSQASTARSKPFAPQTPPPPPCRVLKHQAPTYLRMTMVQRCFLVSIDIRPCIYSQSTKTAKCPGPPDLARLKRSPFPKTVLPPSLPGVALATWVLPSDNLSERLRPWEDLPALLILGGRGRGRRADAPKEEDVAGRPRTTSASVLV